ncbi:hypothetical protein SpCBS45565_g06442 [Spizellomyces sp. 'palustris']|nr:hypothetical protein SpCBS45565_g06442 [Spizellomyces sp. 'palustris']
MSWKGFQKAVTRLPTRLAQRTGYASESVDQEYHELEAQFKHLEILAIRLSDEAKKFKDSLSAMLAHQAKFAETLMEVYQPVTATSPNRPTIEGVETEDYQPPSPTKGVTSPQHAKALAAAEAFATAMQTAREQLLPDLEVIERQVVAPTNDYITMINNVKRLMEKRARKLVDYDRHQDSVKKLAAKLDRNVSDEKKLGSLETSLDQSTREFNNVNNLLKQQLPVFLGYRVAFIDPCFQSLYWYELKVVQTLYDCFQQLCSQHFNMSISAQDGFAAQYDRMMEMLSQLSLLKRPLRKGDGGDTDTGYGGSPDNSPVGQDISGASDAGVTETLPPYEETAARPFPAVSKSAPPAAAVTAYPNPFAAPAPSVAGGSARPIYVLALYDFEGVQEGDLSFKKDDKIEVIQRTGDANDWWMGKLRGQVGQFPGNYVSDL